MVSVWPCSGFIYNRSLISHKFYMYANKNNKSIIKPLPFHMNQTVHYHTLKKINTLKRYFCCFKFYIFTNSLPLCIFEISFIPIRMTSS